MNTLSITIRRAHAADLPAINQIVEAAIMTWKLPERVKRLSLPSYRYTETDLAHQHIVIAAENNNIVGVAAWETADPADTPDRQSALLLHGIYVDPSRQHQGIGRQLYETAQSAACSQALSGLLVKAQADAVPFFMALGMQRVEVKDATRDYANRLWKACTSTPGG